MKLLILFLCSLSGFRTAAHGTFCLSCYQRGSDKCKEKKIYCPEDSRCIAISEIMILDGIAVQSLYKGCAGSAPCDTLSYGSTENSYFAQSYKCCSGNCCNTEKYSEPPADSEEPNGIVCPSCLQFGLKECISTKERECRGSQNKCGNYVGRYRNQDGKESDLSLKSCISSLMCEQGAGIFIGLHELYHTFLNCT